jgi:peptidoglycan/LPS O-acetylase OafA/YrhL
LFRTWTRRRQRALALALAALVVLIALLVWRLWPRPADLFGHRSRRLAKHRQAVEHSANQNLIREKRIER